MPSVFEIAKQIREKNPANQPMTSEWLAQNLFSNREWVRSNYSRGSVASHVANGLAGTLCKAGILRRDQPNAGGATVYILNPPGTKPQSWRCRACFLEKEGANGAFAWGKKIVCWSCKKSTCPHATNHEHPCQLTSTNLP